MARNRTAISWLNVHSAGLFCSLAPAVLLVTALASKPEGHRAALMVHDQRLDALVISQARP